LKTKSSIIELFQSGAGVHGGMDARENAGEDTGTTDERR